MQVIFEKGEFKARCSFAEKDIAKTAGFRWNGQYWFTDNYSVAAKLQPYLDDTARNELSRVRLSIEPWTGGLAVPKDEKLMDFQEDACLFALARNRSYLGLEPGLGKTPISAVIAQSLRNADKDTAFIYICPPFLTRNTLSEFRKWAPLMNSTIYGPKQILGARVVIFADSIIAKEKTLKDINAATRVWKNEKQKCVLFVDEAHRFKNDKALRTRALFDNIANSFDRIIYLSGTPMPNRPMELYPVLSHSASETIRGMSRHQYGLHYCGAYEAFQGWDYSGATNLKELAAQVIGPFMLRVRKKDVLKELPPKIEEMVVLNQDLPPKLMELSGKILDSLSPDDLMKGQIEIDTQKENIHLATYRRELGVLKAPDAIDFIRDILEETDESVLVFAIHKEVISKIEFGLAEYEPLVVVGDTRMELRDVYVKNFQNNPRKRVFIGNIQAAGTGFTLTKATRVVFAEFDWVPANNDQASDRAHRIGQYTSVFVQYLVHESSVDKAVIETVLRKKKITAHI